MSIGSIVVSILSFFVFCCPGIGVVASLTGLGLGLAAAIMAGFDWSKMNSAEMDANGLGITITALIVGVIGTLLGATSLVLSAALTFSVFFGPRLPTLPSSSFRPPPTATAPESD